MRSLVATRVHNKRGSFFYYDLLRSTMGTVDNIVVLENRKIASYYIDTDNNISNHPISNSSLLSFGSANRCNDINFTETLQTMSYQPVALS